MFTDPPVAAVLVVSPPVCNVRGRNVVFGQRYTGRNEGRRANGEERNSEEISSLGSSPFAHRSSPLALRSAARGRLNSEMECISRVVVHPAYRGAGLAVKLVRHALAERRTRHMESLAAMGAVHPLFELAGMRAVHLPPDRHVARLVSAAQAVGIDERRLAAVEPVRRLLQKGGARARFLKREIDLCLARTMDPKRLARTPDPLATVCRRTARQYVYYVSGL
jgi:GNAT superfamily N-acetyltransferase